MLNNVIVHGSRRLVFSIVGFIVDQFFYCSRVLITYPLMRRTFRLADVVDVIGAKSTVAKPTANPVDDVGGSDVIFLLRQDESRIRLESGRQNCRAR